MKNIGIQCREYHGFRHIQAECANTLKTKNKSLDATCTDEGSDCSKDEESNFVSFACRTDNSGAAETESSSSVSSGVPTATCESIDDEDMSNEALVEAYKLLYEKWTVLENLNDKLTGQVFQFDTDKNNLQKTVYDLEKKLKESRENEAELTTKLENMKQSVRMLTFGSYKLDEILVARRPDKEHFGLGYIYTGSGKSIAA